MVQLRCPTCGLPPNNVDLSAGDPCKWTDFLGVERSGAVLMDCDNGHRWIEGYGRDGSELGERSQMAVKQRTARSK
jgi:hypothetical protein